MNKTGLMAKISIKYVLPTSIWKYFWRISRYFAFLGEFRGISWKYLNFMGPRPREISEALFCVVLTSDIHVPIHVATYHSCFALYAWYIWALRKLRRVHYLKHTLYCMY